MRSRFIPKWYCAAGKTSFKGRYKRGHVGDDLAGLIQTVASRHTDGAIYRDADAFQHREQFVVRADARAAAREIVTHALKYFNLPALLMQQIGGKQPAERAADDEGAPCFHAMNNVQFTCGVAQ